MYTKHKPHTKQTKKTKQWIYWKWLMEIRIWLGNNVSAISTKLLLVCATCTSAACCTVTLKRKLLPSILPTCFSCCAVSCLKLSRSFCFGFWIYNALFYLSIVVFPPVKVFFFKQFLVSTKSKKRWYNFVCWNLLIVRSKSKKIFSLYIFESSKKKNNKFFTFAKKKKNRKNILLTKGDVAKICDFGTSRGVK